MQNLTRPTFLVIMVVLLAACQRQPAPTATRAASPVAVATETSTARPTSTATPAAAVTEVPGTATHPLSPAPDGETATRPAAADAPLELSATATAVRPDRITDVDAFVAYLQEAFSISRLNSESARRALQPVVDRDFAFQLVPSGPFPYMDTSQHVVAHLAFGLFRPLKPVFFTERIEEQLPPAVSPQAFYTGEQPLDAVVYSTGWGQNGSAEALLYLVRKDGALRWAGLALSRDNFAPLPELKTVVPAPGLIYRLDESWWQVGADGEAHLLLAHPGPLSFNPGASYAIHAERGSQSLTLFDLGTVGQPVSRTLALDYTLMQEVRAIAWLDEQTAVLMVTKAGEGLTQGTTGSMALLDVLSGELQLLAPEVSIYAEPVPTGDGAIIFDALAEARSFPAVWRDSEVTPLPLAELAGIESEPHSPVPSPDGSKVAAIGFWPSDPSLNAYWLFDLEQAGAHVVVAYTPIGTDANLPPGVSWDSSGEWLALRPETGDPLQAGVWLMRADGSEQQFLGVLTANPVWRGGTGGPQLLFNATIAGEVRLQQVDAATGERVWLDVPVGTVPIQAPPEEPSR
jgi:hypothetical protein